MKLRQGEMKKTMKGILAGAFLLAAGSAAVFAVGTETELKAYAAEWQQAEKRRLDLQRRRWQPGIRLAEDRRCLV